MKDQIIEGMNRILRHASSSESRDAYGKIILDVAKELTDSSIGFLGEVDEQKGLLEIVATSFPERIQSYPPEPTEEKTGPIVHGVYQNIILNGKSTYTNEPAVYSVDSSRYMFQAFLGVPLILNDISIGMIGVADRKGGYRKEDVIALEALNMPTIQVITRKRTERSLLESMAGLEAAQRIVRMGNWDLDITHDRLSWSEEIYKIFELDSKEFGASYEAFLSIIHPDDREAVDNAYTKSLQDREPYEISHRLQMRDGRIKFVHERCETFYDAQNRPIRSIGTVQDITDRKRAEKILAREAELATALLELHHEAPRLPEREIYVSTLYKAICLSDSRIGFLQPCARGLKSNPPTIWYPESLTNPTGAKPHSGDDTGSWFDCRTLRDSIISNEISSPSNLKEMPEGYQVTRFMSHPVIQDGKIRCIIGVGNKETDYDDIDMKHLELMANELARIVEQRSVEKEIRKLNATLDRRVKQRTAQLTAVNKELEAFAYSVSHDLRAPLRSINGFSQALIEDYEDILDSQGKDYLQRVSAESRRMAQIIDDLLRLSRITRAEMRTEKVDFSALGHHIFEQLRDAEPQRRAEIIVAENLTTKGDPPLLRLALENLLSNAWKFTGGTDNARIELGRLPNKEEEIFFVKDNGVGFEMKYAHNLFRPFQRLHDMEEFPGTGIGLCTVQRIVSRHGGRVWCESELNRGSVFYFTCSPGKGSRPCPDFMEKPRPD